MQKIDNRWEDKSTKRKNAVKKNSVSRKTPATLQSRALVSANRSINIKSPCVGVSPQCTSSIT